MTCFSKEIYKRSFEFTGKDKVTKAEVLKRTGQQRKQNIVGERRFRFATARYLIRMAPERPARSAMDWTPADRRRR